MDSSSPRWRRAHDWRLVRPVTREEPKMDIIRVGIDLAKSVFQVHGVDRSEKAVWCRKLARAEWLDVLQRTVPLHAVIGMEACGLRNCHASGTTSSGDRVHREADGPSVCEAVRQE